MRVLISFFSLLGFFAVSEARTSSLAKAERATDASCTLTASGGDDAPQFLAAGQSCGTVTIPTGTTLNIETRLNMTGFSNLHINLEGTIRFNPDIPYWSGNAFSIPFQNSLTFWLLGGENVILNGGGTLDGAGQAWWDDLASNSSLLRPIILTLNEATNAVVENIRMINSPIWFNLVNQCQNVTYNNISINAVSTSDNFIANTDGWDIYRSDSVTIENSVINNGDDCVSFKPNSTNILVSNLNCNGSHGISVGSLGEFAGVFDIVQNVTAINVQMSNAENGARIKAFAGSGVGSGRVQNITFQNFVVSEVDSPVVIDQCYETDASACEEFPSNVIIQDVLFSNITGTGTSSEVASLDCSPDGRCSDITVDSLDLTGAGGKTTFECQNVQLEGSAASLFGTCTTT